MAAKREIYLQFKHIADQVQVSAIDSVSGIEVSIFGPRATSQKELERIVVAKLERRLAGQKDKQTPQPRPSSGLEV